MSLSVIMPTLGRDMLERAVKSVLAELVEGDQLIVVGDGPQPRAEEVVKGLARVRYLETPPTRCWGHAQRNLGMRAAESTHLAWLDDDDVWLPGARSAIGGGIESFPDDLLFFRMQLMDRTIWKEPEIRLGNTSTQMYVFPNRPGMLRQWERHPSHKTGRGGDHMFAWQTAALGKGQVRFLEPVIAQVFDYSMGKGPTS